MGCGRDASRCRRGQAWARPGHDVHGPLASLCALCSPLVFVQCVACSHQGSGVAAGQADRNTTVEQVRRNNTREGKPAVGSIVSSCTLSSCVRDACSTQLVLMARHRSRYVSLGRQSELLSRSPRAMQLLGATDACYSMVQYSATMFLIPFQAHCLARPGHYSMLAIAYGATPYSPTVLQSFNTEGKRE